jgi:hypothetical protein
VSLLGAQPERRMIKVVHRRAKVLSFQRADEPLGPNGASAVTTFLPLLLYTGRSTYSVQMNIYDRAAKNKKKVGS